MRGRCSLTLATTGGREARCRPAGGAPGAGESNDGCDPYWAGRPEDGAAGGGNIEGLDLSRSRSIADGARSALASRSNGSLASIPSRAEEGDFGADEGAADEGKGACGICDGRSRGTADGRSGGMDGGRSDAPEEETSPRDAIFLRTRRRPGWGGGRPESLLDIDAFLDAVRPRAARTSYLKHDCRFAQVYPGVCRAKPKRSEAFTHTPARGEHPAPCGAIHSRALLALRSRRAFSPL